MRHMMGVGWNAVGAMWTHAIGQLTRPARLVLVGLLGLCGALGVAVAAAPALPIEYLALGDSVASGRGLADDETACR